ncbi:MAG: TIGR04086 family membrane protein [Clostridiales bacterium]|nr:TIGR04086 family membrane protein [Clostridiales bacterium]
MSESFLSVVLQIIKSVIISLIFLFFGVTALSLIVNTANLSVSVLHPVVQVLKPVAILTGVLCGVRGTQGALKGLFAGALAFATVYLILAFMGNGRYVFRSVLIDFLAFLLFGVCSGILAISLKNR